MELEHLNKPLHEATAQSASPTVTRAPARADALQQLQHALGNRSLTRLVQTGNETAQAAQPRTREASDAGAEARSDAAELAAAHAATTESGGEPLPSSERAYFEPLFGQDFGGVRLHTGAGAARSAASLGARAYALGHDIAFAPGHYAPTANAGRRLLAHELAHVVQQRQPGAGRDAERNADAAAAEVSEGRAVTPQAVGSAAAGLHADNGTTILPGESGPKPAAYSFKLPPLKLSRWMFSYLLTHNLLTPQVKQMLLDGELEVDWTEPAPSFPLSPESAGQRGTRLWSELDPLRQRLLDAGTTLREPVTEPAYDLHMRPFYDPVLGSQPSSQKPVPAWTPPAPEKESGPSFFEKHFEWKGLSDGLDIKVPYLHPNISLSGLTVDVLKVGRFSMKAVKNIGKGFEVQMTYRDWHLSGSVDTDGKWLLKLTYPTDAPMPDASALGNIFRQGERALEEAVKTLGTTLPKSDFGTLKDRVSVLADPLMNAADAGKNLKKAASGVNVSLVIGAGPAPGQLPEEVLRGVESPAAMQEGFFGGLNITYSFF